jgi:uncharacterized protein
VESLPVTSESSFVLKPSRIHGVGVFATHAIKKGVRLRLFARNESVRYLRNTPKRRHLVARYGVPMGDDYFVCAADFGRMSVGWYLNHSDAPNAFRKAYVYYSRRNIRAGEEITIDYGTL